jgi:hypothetical protein
MADILPPSIGRQLFSDPLRVEGENWCERAADAQVTRMVSI